jgi:hypothetical protein
MVKGGIPFPWFFWGGGFKEVEQMFGVEDKAVKLGREIKQGMIQWDGRTVKDTGERGPNARCPM